jgi:hypothetical protein
MVSIKGSSETYHIIMEGLASLESNLKKMRDNKKEAKEVFGGQRNNEVHSCAERPAGIPLQEAGDFLCWQEWHWKIHAVGFSLTAFFAQPFQKTGRLAG